MCNDVSAGLPAFMVAAYNLILKSSKSVARNVLTPLLWNLQWFSLSIKMIKSLYSGPWGPLYLAPPHFPPTSSSTSFHSIPATLAFCSCPRSFASAFLSAWNVLSQNNCKALLHHFIQVPVQMPAWQGTSQILLLKTALFPSIILPSFSVPLPSFFFFPAPLPTWNIYIYLQHLSPLPTPCLECKLH